MIVTRKDGMLREFKEKLQTMSKPWPGGFISFGRIAIAVASERKAIKSREIRE